jgi:hypothetical protein
MRDFLENYGFHIQLILVGLCWMLMALYVYERIREKNNKK